MPWLSLKSIIDLLTSRTKETLPTGKPKELKLIDIKRVIEEPGITGIKIHPKTWERLIQPFAPQRVAVPGKSSKQKIFFSGKPVELDDTIEEEKFEPISN